MRGGGKLTPALFVGAFGVIMCGLLVVMTNYAKVQLKQRAASPAGAAAPAGKYEARIKSLSREAYFTTQRDGLDNNDEPHTGRWVRHAEPGVYLDVVSDRVLFASTAKLESVEGFAEFSAPAAPDVVEEVPRDPPVVRLRSRAAGTWLGRVVPDRANAGAKRYIINSTALAFVPAAELEARGLSEWRRLFPAGNGSKR
jgi:peptide-methionine (R)-S-oxide reductase